MNVAPASGAGRIFRHTGDIDGHVKISPMRRPWMVRIVDVAAALDGIPAAVPGEVSLHVADELGPWNEGTYRLSCDGTRLTVEAAPRGPADGTDAATDRAAATDLALSIEQLSALLYGAAPPEEILRQPHGVTSTGAGAPRADAEPAGGSAAANGSPADADRAGGSAAGLMAAWFPERFLWNDWGF
jgi:hypothetical protein